MEIAVKKGARGCPVNQWSSHPSELEILFKAGSRFLVKEYNEAQSFMKLELV
jgi:hypothetical protein